MTVMVSKVRQTARNVCGIGTKLVTKTMEKYGGILCFVQQHGWFYMRMILPVKQMQKT